jgi:hypothetical protein
VRVVPVLLALSFLLELCLLAAVAVVGASIPQGTVMRILVSVVLVLVTATVWGVLLSPRRRFDAPLSVRVIVEFALFAGASIGLAAQGHETFGAVLMFSEIVVVVALAMLGHPPGGEIDPDSLPSVRVP